MDYLGHSDDNYPAYGRLLMKICAPGAHVLKVRSAPVLDFQQHSPHMLNSFESLPNNHIL